MTTRKGQNIHVLSHVLSSGDHEVVFEGWGYHSTHQKTIVVVAKLNDMVCTGTIPEPAARALWTALRRAGFSGTVRWSSGATTSIP